MLYKLMKNFKTLCCLLMLCLICTASVQAQVECSSKPTRYVFVKGNIDSGVAINSSIPFGSESFDEFSSSAHFQYTMPIFDSKEVAHDLHFYFYKIDLASSTHNGILVFVVTEGTGIYPNSGEGKAFVLAKRLLTFDDRNINASPYGHEQFSIAPFWYGASNLQIDINLSFSYMPSANTITAATQQGYCHGAYSDFDGDTIQDQYVYRPEFGIWAVRNSYIPNDPQPILYRQWGLAGDIPFAADYTGDGKADLVVWRPSNGFWYVCKSETNFDCFGGESQIQQFGLPGDRPILQDKDNDGIYDFAVYRPSEGLFYVLRSIDGQVEVNKWGLPGDIPGGAFGNR